jgi:hypothetical protein
MPILLKWLIIHSNLTIRHLLIRREYNGYIHSVYISKLRLLIIPLLIYVVLLLLLYVLLKLALIGLLLLRGHDSIATDTFRSSIKLCWDL